jgi:hypothetical protein
LLGTSRLLVKVFLQIHFSLSNMGFEKTITHFQIPCYHLPTVIRPGLCEMDVLQE